MILDFYDSEEGRVALKPNQLKGGVALNYLAQILKLIIGVVYTPVMIRLLGQSEYGLYNIAASVIAYLGILDFGFGSAYMRFYSRYKENAEEEKVANLNGMFLTIFSVIGLVAVVAGVIVALNVEVIFGPSLTGQELQTARIMMLILVINLTVSFPNVVFDGYMQANERFIASNILLILKQVSTPLLNLPILLAGHGSVGMVIGSTLVNVIIEIATIIFCIKKLNIKISFKVFDWKLFKEMSSFSFFIFINIIVDQVNNNIGKTILGRYQGTVAVAIYSVGANINMYYTSISSTIASVFTPRVHRMEANNESASNFTTLLIRVGRIQFILLSLVFSGFIFFGKSFINLWVGDGYENSYYVALILMFTITVPLIQNLSIEIQRAKNMHQFRSWVYLGMAVLNIIISIPLSQVYGVVGVAVGTAVSYLVVNGGIMNLYNHYKVGLSMVRFWKEIISLIPSLILPILYGVVISNFIDLYNVWNLISFGIVYIIVFAISIWLLGLNNYEKNLVKSPFK